MRTQLAPLLVGLVLTLPAVAADIPRPAPNFTIKLPGGATQQLQQYRGKVIALEFLLTTCPHCQRSSKTLNKLQQEYGAERVQVLGVAINPMAHMLVPDYVKEFQLSYPVGYDEPDAANTFLQHPTILRMLMPQVVFIDRAGNIRAQYSGDDPFFANEEANMRAKINELLKEAIPGTTASSKKKQ